MWRRVLRGAAVAALGLLALVAVAAAVAVLVFSSEWGQERLRRAVEAQASEALEGTVEIGALRVTLRGQVVARDLVVRAEDGREVVRADVAELDLRVRALLRRSVIIDRLAIVRATLWVRIDEDGETNITALLGEDRDPTRTTVILRDVTFEDSRVIIDVVGQERFALDDVALAGSMRIEPVGTVVQVTWSQSVWREPGLPLAITGTVYREEDDVVIGRDIVVRTPASVVRAESIDVDAETGAVRALVSASLDAAEVIAVCQRTELAENLARYCERAAGWPVSKIDAGAELARTRTGAAWSVRGHVRSTDRALLVAAEASVIVQPEAAFPRAVQGTASATVVLTEGEGTTTISAQAELVRDELAGTAHLIGPRGDGQARWRVDLGGEAPVIDELEARGRGVELAALSAGAVAGIIDEIALRAAGPVGALDVELRGRARQVAIATPEGPVRIRRARVDARATALSLTALSAWPGAAVLPRAAVVDIDAAGVRYQGQRLDVVTLRGRVSEGGARAAASLRVRGAGPVTRAELDVTAARTAAGGLDARLERYALVARGLRWAGRGGSVAISPRGRVDVRDVALRSAAGAVALDATLDSRARRRDELRVRVARLDLGRVALAATGAATGASALAGEVSGEVVIRRGRRHWLARGSATVDGLRRGAGQPPVSGAVHVDLGEERLTATVDAAMARHGRVSLALDTRLPARPFELASWQRDPIARVDTLRLELASFPLAVLMPGEPVRGLIDGVVALAPRGQALDLDLTARDLVVTARARPLAVRATGVWDAGGLAGDITAGDARGRVLTASYGLDAPIETALRVALGRALDGRRRGAEARQAHAAFSRLMQAPLRVSSEVRGLELQRIHGLWRTDHAVAPRVTGRVHARIEVTGTLRRPRMIVDRGTVTGLSVSGMALTSVTFSADLRRDQASATISARQGRSGLLQGSGTLDWGAEPVLRADVTARDFDLTALRVLARSDISVLATVTGTVDARVRVEGSPRAPGVSGHVEATNLGMWLADGSRRLHGGAVTIALAPDRVLIRQASAYLDRGVIRASGSIDLAGLRPERVQLWLRSRDVAIPAGRYTAFVSASAMVTGGVRDDELGLDVRIAPGARVVARRGDPALQDLGRLEDVIYAGDVPRRPRQRVELPLVSAVRVRVTAPRGVHLHASQWAELVVAPRPAVEIVLRDRGDLEFHGALEATRGRVMLFDHRYRVVNALVQFAGSLMQTSLNLELLGEFRSATVAVSVVGRALDPEITLASDPPMDETTTLAIMLGQEPDQTDESLSAGAVSIGNVLASQLRAKLPVGVDVVRTHPDGITVGRWITNNLLAGYRYRTTPESRQNRNEATIRWRIHPSWLLEGFYGDNDSGGVDVLWNRRF